MTQAKGGNFSSTNFNTVSEKHTINDDQVWKLGKNGNRFPLSQKQGLEKGSESCVTLVSLREATSLDPFFPRLICIF